MKHPEGGEERAKFSPNVLLIFSVPPAIMGGPRGGGEPLGSKILSYPLIFRICFADTLNPSKVFKELLLGFTFL